MDGSSSRRRILLAALITLRRRRSSPGGRRATIALAGLGIFGAALFFGDSMITPAISVLSAVEGIKVVNPSFEGLVIPVTVVIVVALFACSNGEPPRWAVSSARS